MGLDGVSPAALVFPLLNFTFGTIQTGFELGSTPAETNSLIKTIEQVSTELKSAYRVRKALSQKDNISDLTRIDDAIRNTEDAVHGVQALTERARVDMSTRYGKVGTRSRILWVVRDSKKVQTALMRLAIANACLKSSIDEAYRQQISTAHTVNHAFGDQNNWKSADDAFHGVAPPPYEEATKASMFERRRFKDRRNSVRRSPSLLSTEDAPFGTLPNRESTYSLAFPATPALSHLDDLRGYVQNNEDMLQSVYARPSPCQSEEVVMASLDDSANVRCELRPCFELEAIPASAPIVTANSTSTYQPYNPAGPASSVLGPVPPFLETLTQRHEPPAQQASLSKSTFQTRPYVPYSQPTNSLTSSSGIPSPFAFNTISSERQDPLYPVDTQLRPPPSRPSLPQGSSARLPSILHPGPRPYSLSGQSISDSRLDLGLPQKKLGKPPRETPLAWRAKDTLRTPKSSSLSSSSMESEAWIPGQKKPMQIRWQEPDDDDDESHSPITSNGGIKVGSDNPYAFPDRELGEIAEERQSLSLPDLHADTSAPPEQVLTSTRSRRRPARFASGPTNLPSPATSTPSAMAGAPSAPPRRGLTGMRKSRTEWLVEQGTGASSLI